MENMSLRAQRSNLKPNESFLKRRRLPRPFRPRNDGLRSFLTEHDLKKQSQFWKGSNERKINFNNGI
jgi:hypothetical protein